MKLPLRSGDASVTGHRARSMLSGGTAAENAHNPPAPSDGTRMNKILLCLTLSLPLATSGCAVVSVAGAAAGAAISVTGAVVSTGVKVTGKVVEKTIDLAVPDSEPAP